MSHHDTGCCGYNFKEKNASFLGLLTFSIPVILIGGVLLPFLFLLSLILPKLGTAVYILKVVIRANLKLIQMASFYPKIKCKLVGRTLKFSPEISGLIYKNFNLIFLVTIWFLVGDIVCLMVF